MLINSGKSKLNPEKLAILLGIIQEMILRNIVLPKISK